MALYIVVRHADNPDKTYNNVWSPDNRLLLSITAPKDVAMSLAAERELGNRVFVHRCAWGSEPAKVCCSVHVDKVAAIDRREYLVTFVEQQPLDCEPPIAAHQGQNSYAAPPISSAGN